MGSEKGEHGPFKTGREKEPTIGWHSPIVLSRAVIGKRLKIVRLIRERTQQEVASAAGFGNGVVSNTERGEREMTYHEAVVYARVLCFCLNGFARTEADGRWDMMACLLPYTPPAKGPENVEQEGDPL